MPAQMIQNPSALIGNVLALDGNSVGFPAWRTRLEELFAIQGVHDIVTGKLVRPEADSKDKDSKPITQGSQCVYYAEESGSDWDSLSDVAWATLKMTLSIDLAIQYKEVKPVSVLFKTICNAYEKNTRARRMMLQDTFWSARHYPNQPIAKWIAKVCNAASDLKSVKLTPADQQICDRLLRGLDNSWKPIRDHLVYSPSEISLDDAIGALEAYKVSTQVSFNNPQEMYAAPAVVKKKKTPGCWTCGEFGHHSSACPNPPLKNKSKARANMVEARAGATSTVPLGDGGPRNDEEDDFDPEIDVCWG
ncbi:uncharacterized protein PGTG_12541 [Puccinia graminis f. sp. tritici CRL 75-36-700-3]|uniref:CCHC-type domain-containing protein n=1 Tax=Puccinia graminis f. sp. tritici (strain CRL 75-36-700-3 / race SCCL) TaxID=418459 RepID=E3KUZ4_PUCGT|nr:uncharacterized protein PGTG_12541 [Puccinia graminis f. sp. tritici CRL 75-36-700-3]EFP88094.1 hypothetical protein PGTG_12541 [Puccinia graminis f. sp. tritici CRL 75-36-700-3]